ncbi:unnamed protein product [Cylicocyclus nassatus]|uniref:Uncharacterized protein n=1 Tax=Cylicocyclus nassatus TaxID=53992 RepID=A0AA36DRE2_CYLNA|nr:unnamed protein product [Cylicocyclus nassatus]
MFYKVLLFLILIHVTFAGKGKIKNFGGPPIAPGWERRFRGAFQDYWNFYFDEDSFDKCYKGCKKQHPKKLFLGIFFRRGRNFRKCVSKCMFEMRRKDFEDVISTSPSPVGPKSSSSSSSSSASSEHDFITSSSEDLIDFKGPLYKNWVTFE